MAPFTDNCARYPRRVSLNVCDAVTPNDTRYRPVRCTVSVDVPGVCVNTSLASASWVSHTIATVGSSPMAEPVDTSRFWPPVASRSSAKRVGVPGCMSSSESHEYCAGTYAFFAPPSSTTVSTTSSSSDAANSMKQPECTVPVVAEPVERVYT